jgi:putative GTP pyrophosphokinase
MNILTKKYIDERSRFEDYRKKVESLIRELLDDEKIKYHKIESRTKAPESLEKKIYSKSEKYQELGEITDIVGIRIITFFEDEVDKVASLINSEFDIDPSNSIDKRNLESDRF